jgi:hypothetical protein
LKTLEDKQETQDVQPARLCNFNSFIAVILQSRTVAIDVVAAAAITAQTNGHEEITKKATTEVTEESSGAFQWAL